jgi:hypothetical protein
MKLERQSESAKMESFSLLVKRIGKQHLVESAPQDTRRVRLVDFRVARDTYIIATGL